MPVRVNKHEISKDEVPIRCPDCGLVLVKLDAWNGEQPISGLCPDCGERLYFENERPQPEMCK